MTKLKFCVMITMVQKTMAVLAFVSGEVNGGQDIWGTLHLKSKFPYLKWRGQGPWSPLASALGASLPWRRWQT